MPDTAPKIFSFALQSTNMYHATVNNLRTFDVELDNTAANGTVNGNDIALDIIEESGGLHILWNNRSFNAEIVSIDKAEKMVVVKVNSTLHEVKLKDRFDDLLKNLGMEGAGQAKVKNIKAPMPGMVLNILVGEGETVTKDQPVVILEAMKMENVIKSPVEGTIKKVGVAKGVAVEKNTILIEFA
jgi:biotin carboxyl carrier protein